MQKIQEIHAINIAPRAMALSSGDWAEKQRVLGSSPSMDKTWKVSFHFPILPEHLQSTT